MTRRTWEGWRHSRVSWSAVLNPRVLLVGQSGSGKSNAGVGDPAAAGEHGGEILSRGQNLLRYSAGEMRRIRGKEIGVVFQGASSASNPALRLRVQLREEWRAHRGAAQRVLIALAMMHRPALVVADEPTSALDMVTQAEVLGLMRGLRDRFGSSLLFISHDLAAVSAVCDRLAILREGEIVEVGSSAEIFAAPDHPSTAELPGAIPGWSRAIRSAHL